jgi:hypothetical protein
VPLFSRHWPDSSQTKADPQRLLLQGPALQIQIDIPDDLATILAREGKPVPPPQTGTALIDTGASFTAVEEVSLKALGLAPSGVAPIWTPSGSKDHAIYACKLSFPGTPIQPLTFNAVVGCQLQGFGHQALFGRDILQYFLLVYNGPEGIWTLAF